MALKGKDSPTRKSKSAQALDSYLDDLLPATKMASPHRAITGAVMVQRSLVNPGENIREDAKADLNGFRDGILALRDLGLGIEGSGILQPLIGVEKNGQIDLVFGNRRFWSTEASHTELPFLLVPDPEAARVVMQVLENHNRKGFNLREEIAAAQAMSRAGYSIRDIAKLMGEHRRWVENRLNLGKAKPDIQELLTKHLDAPGVTLTNLLLIESVSNQKLRQKLIDAAKGELTERELRARINPTTGNTNTAATGGLGAATGGLGAATGGLGAGAGGSGVSSSTGITVGRNLAPATGGSDNSTGHSGAQNTGDQNAALVAEPQSTKDVVVGRLRDGVKGLSDAAAILEGRKSTVALQRAVERELAQVERQLSRIKKAAQGS